MSNEIIFYILFLKQWQKVQALLQEVQALLQEVQVLLQEVQVLLQEVQALAQEVLQVQVHLGVLQALAHLKVHQALEYLFQETLMVHIRYHLDENLQLSLRAVH